MAGSRFSVGIDLGTTNCSLAFIDLKKKKEKAATTYLDIPQIVAEGEVGARRLLPSYAYLPGGYETSPLALKLPWGSPDGADLCIGEFARTMGARVPGKVVSSAKSWLCHRMVDRKAPILPWGKDERERGVSPLDAAALYLSHLREAWNHIMAGDDEKKRLDRQEIILTVPASFDEVARELTVEASHKAGLGRVILLEEPQAAFYSWLLSHEASWQKQLKNIELILVCDIGGGTTDFTLIRVERRGEELSLRRISVGEHLMLGGDNMDIALAHHMEQKIGLAEKKLDSQRMALLCQECRNAKERILGQELDELPITVAGRGSRLIGGALQGVITREEITGIIEKGFFPATSFFDPVQHMTGLGLREWGLPYSRDAAVTRHLAEFLRIHLLRDGPPDKLAGDEQREIHFPDAVLFNGGVLKSERLQSLIISSMEGWRGELEVKGRLPVRILKSIDLDLAVSRGAAYFGTVREGRGVRIGGGTPRSFYVALTTEEKGGTILSATQTILCLIPKDLLTETVVEIHEHEFALLLGRPVSFPLFSSTSRGEDLAGALLEVKSEALECLPPLYTVLQSREAASGEVPVFLKAWITEIGTLELWCVARNTGEQWKLQFALDRTREEAGASSGSAPASVPPQQAVLDTALITASKELVTQAFQKKSGKSGTEEVKPRGLLYRLEEFTREKREGWSTAYTREIFDALLSVVGRRRSSELHEAAWLNCAGFSLRPGVGYPLDDWRITQLWQLFPHWLQFNKDSQCRLEWWIMWRRVAAGLPAEAQHTLFDRISPYYFSGKKHLKSFPGPLPTKVETGEILRMAAVLEGISIEHKILLGNYIMDSHLLRHESPQNFWALARIGARIPFSSSLHAVVTPGVIEEWLSRILAVAWRDFQGSGGAFALVNMARLTGDRNRDIDETLRHEIIERLEREGCDEKLTAPLKEIVEEKSEDQELIFGESLPRGLMLKRQKNA
ncbi:MAG: Hsp70 family protein [Vulcanimicrobiota bacterium]